MKALRARVSIGMSLAAALVLTWGTAGALECRYEAKGDAPAELSAHGACGHFAGPDDFRIAREHLASLRFRGGLAALQVDDKAFYVDRSGKTVRVHVFENGADYFSEGLARAVSRGKFGFVDRRLRLVIKPRYDFAFPFSGGRAIVCLGCSTVADGEHRALRGGRWGMIDRTGARIVPIRYTLEAVQALQRSTRVR